MNKLTLTESPIKLDGFNNLNKTLRFNMYDFCVTRNEQEMKDYTSYIYKKFNAKTVTKMLSGVCEIIEANILAVSDQDYDPWGSSSLVLMSDIKGSGINDVKMHLDKSHICSHTYPDFRAKENVSSFRIDIDVSTCGEISPLLAVNYLLNEVNPDIIVCDYFVRGSTRDASGNLIFMDHDISSIQNYINKEILKNYHCLDLLLPSVNIWQTKMLRTNIEQHSLFIDKTTINKIKSHEDIESIEKVKKEMLSVFNMIP